MMQNVDKTFEKYIRAKDRTRCLRKFYITAVRLAIATIILLLLKDRVLEMLSANGVENESTLYWLEWNMLALPIIFIVILTIKGFKIFVTKSNLIKEWEEKQIEKLMKEDKNGATGYQ